MADYQFAGTNHVTLARAAETVFGETPNPSRLKVIHYNSESLKQVEAYTASEEIRNDRMYLDTYPLMRNAEGDIVSDWAYNQYDDFMQAALLGGAWAPTVGVATTSKDMALITSSLAGAKGLTSPSLKFLTTKRIVPNSYVRVDGFRLGAFFAKVVDIKENELFLVPTKIVGNEAASLQITITPMDYIRTGTTKYSFVVQKIFNDLAKAEHHTFNGMRVGTWGLEFATSSLIKSTFGFTGQNSVMTDTQNSQISIDPDTTLVKDRVPFNSVDDVSYMHFGANPVNRAYFSSLSLNIDNTLRGQEAIGAKGYIGIEAGRSMVSGSGEMYFATGAEFRKFTSDSEFSFTIHMTDPKGNVYIVEMPRVKYTNCEVVSGGSDADIFANVEFSALIDNLGKYQLQICRKGA